MINAQIVNTSLGIQDFVPYMVLTFNYYNEIADKIETVSTQIIALIDTTTETLNNSAMAYIFNMILNVVGVSKWENLIGTSVRIELDKNNIPIKIQNFITNEFCVIAASSETLETNESNANDNMVGTEIVTNN